MMISNIVIIDEWRHANVEGGIAVGGWNLTIGTSLSHDFCTPISRDIYTSMHTHGAACVFNKRHIHGWVKGVGGRVSDAVLGGWRA